jgi:hypothetical protein
MFKGIVFIESQWYFLADEALTQAIDPLEAGDIKIEFLKQNNIFPDSKISGEEQQLTELHGVACLLRGYARMNADSETKNELSMTDLEKFLDDMESLNVSNELVWVVGAYVNIKKENTDEAIRYLQLIQKSNELGTDEKEVVNQTIEYLDKRESGKALNTIFDKTFVAKIMLNYLVKCYTKADWYKKVENSKTGAQLLRYPKVIQDYTNQIEIPSTKNVTDQGKELWEKVGNSE